MLVYNHNDTLTQTVRPARSPAQRAARAALDDHHGGVRPQRAPGRRWPSTSSAAPCTRPSSKTRTGRPTWPGSTSSTPARADFYPDWDDAADTSVALLRTEAGRDPYDRGLTDLVGELSTRSEAFRTRWAAHDVRLHRTGVKHFRHPAVGRLDLTFDAMEIPTDRGLTMTCYTAEPGTASEENLKLLASWAATMEQDAGMVTPQG